ncbi:NUDIX hydrolase [Alteromonadaceae bacterium M269]|nr:NUDIX hydrolase [Alteromonadaceae bacterium M269]
MKHRISVGALITENNEILLVNHKLTGRYDFWVAPGGGVKGTESLHEATIREVKEETGFDVQVGNLLYIEEMYEPTTRLIKFWYQCKISGGELNHNSPLAKSETIVDAKFISRKALQNKDVFPSVLNDTFWIKLTEKDPAPEHIPLRKMDFY